MLVSLMRTVVSVLGSLLLTVAILVVLVAILLWGTVVEKNYGATAAKFGIYGSWWFNGLGFLLGLNSTVALIRRLPWKRQQLGFILPHLGLVVLLVGCLLSRLYGVEATLMVPEGESSDLAYKSSSQHVELDGQQQFTLDVISADGRKTSGEPIVVRFTSGPFNWDDYHNGALSVVPWSLAHRDQGVLYDRDGIRLEVLDYLSNSEIVHLPSLAVRAASRGSDGGELPEQAKTVQLSVNGDVGQDAPGRPYGIGSEQKLAGGQRVVFWMTGSSEETEAFRQSKLEGRLGRLGRVVLYARGRSYEFSVTDWPQGTRRPLGDSGLEAEFMGISLEPLGDKKQDPVDVRVHLKIHHGAVSHELVLSADYPEAFSQQDYDDQVFGAYWFGLPSTPPEDAKNKADAPAAPTGDNSKTPDSNAKAELPAKAESKTESAAKTETTAKPDPKQPESSADVKADSKAKPEAEQYPPLTFGPPRIEFLQGADQQLYLRTWRGGDVTVSGPLKMGEDGGRITAFRGTPDEVVLWFGDFHPADQPDYSARSLSFDKSDEIIRLRQAYVRLTVDDQSAEFWIPCASPENEFLPETLARKAVAGKGRQVELSFAPESFRLGYSVHLRKARRKLDPGTRQASFYGSKIDLLPSPSLVVSSSAALPPKQENLLVTLNQPLDFVDPASGGRSYRMFQSSMNPNNREDVNMKLGDSVYVSGFTLNYDPGRGLIYVGCLLVVAGIFVAYFVRFVKK